MPGPGDPCGPGDRPRRAHIGLSHGPVEHNGGQPGVVARRGVGDHRGAPDVLLQGLEHLHGRGQEELEAESAEDVQAGPGELGVGLVEGLVEDHQRIPGNRLPGLGELVAQRGRQAEDDELLALPARQARGPLVVVDGHARGVALDGGEGDVQAGVQALPLPRLVVGIGGAQARHDGVENGEAGLGLLGRLVGQIEAAGGDRGQIRQEVVNDRQSPLRHLDVEVMARRVLGGAQGVVDGADAAPDLADGAPHLSGELADVLTGLVVEELGEAALETGQAIGLKAVQQVEVVAEEGRLRPHLAARNGPALGEAHHDGAGLAQTAALLLRGALIVVGDLLLDLAGGDVHLRQPRVTAPRAEPLLQLGEEGLPLGLVQGAPTGAGLGRAGITGSGLLGAARALGARPVLVPLLAPAGDSGQRGLGVVEPRALDLLLPGEPEHRLPGLVLGQTGGRGARLELGQTRQRLRRAPALRDQLGLARPDAVDVDLLPGGLQDAQARVAALPGGGARATERAELLVDGFQPVGHLPTLGDHLLEALGGIDADRPVARVGQVPAVVLEVTGARGLDLPGAGDPPVQTDQVARVLDAGVVESAHDLGIEPPGVLGAGPGSDPASQGIGGHGRGGVPRGRHALVGEAGAQAPGVDGGRHLAVEVLRNEHGAGEGGDDGLDGDAPLLLPGNELEDLPGEGQGGGGLPDGVGDGVPGAQQVRAHGRARGGDLLGALAQLATLLHQGELFGAQGAAGLVLLPLGALGALDLLRRGALELGEGGSLARRGGAQDVQLGVEEAPGPRDALGGLTGRVQAGVESGQVLPEATGQGEAGGLPLPAGVLLDTAGGGELIGQAVQRAARRVRGLLVQGRLELLQVGVDGRAQLLGALLIAARLGDALLETAQRGQQGLLVAGLDDGGVGLAQLGELLDGGRRHGEGVRLVEHEVTQEGVEAGEVLGGLGPVEQALRDLAGQAQAPAEAGREGLVALEAGGAPLQITAEAALVDAVGQVLHELGQGDVPLDEQLGLGDGVGRDRALPGVVELDESDRLLGAQSRERQGDAAAGGARAQVVGDDLAGDLIGAAPVGAADVAQDGAGAIGRRGVLSGRVEAQVLGRHEDGGQRVQQRGLPRARGAGEQEPAARDRKVVMAGEGAPVVDLDTGQAVLRGGLRRGRRAGHDSSLFFSASSVRRHPPGHRPAPVRPSAPRRRRGARPRRPHRSRRADGGTRPRRRRPRRRRRPGRGPGRPRSDRAPRSRAGGRPV